MDTVLVYKKSKGKSLCVVALPSGKIEVRVPQRMSFLVAKAFMCAKTELVKNLVQKQEKNLSKLKSEFDGRLFEIHDKEKLALYKKEALCFVEEALSQVDIKKEFTYKKVQIKNTSSRWGSCSSKGALSFHYKILFLPRELQKYLLVHELCHLKEMNHSKRFWDAVKKEYNEYEEARRKLKALPIFS